MRKILFLFTALLIISGAEAKKPTKKLFSKKQAVVEEVVVVKPAIVMANETDSMSYALGVNIATDLAQNLKTLPGGVYNTEVFLAGFNAALKGDSTLLDNEDAQEFLQAFFTTAQQKVSNEKKSEGEKFLAENAKNPAVQTTPSGLQYIVMKDAEGDKPAETDKVRVHYEGTLINGTKFDSSYDRGEPIDFTLNQVIRGWTEGVMLMSPGAKYKFFIPYHLAYGEQGAGNVIPPFATLIFTVELIAINPVAITDQIKQLEIQ
jgi:FKBP-type peptidyl-prolyl cis-trans isomerase